jgi:UDP-N-acetylglucosamine--N-acetylmuramyl-(pentapeptide) pyrophosphoryl-undecaprenol N-acetylglucosamine transferase
MDCAFSAADLVITRAGANTIAELVATRTAAVLIPYPYARAHQLDNARFLTDKAAALLIEDSRLDKDILKETILDLKNNPQKLKIMSEKLAAIDMPDARNKMAVLAWELANARN